jgi:hypothetical protein
MGMALDDEQSSLAVEVDTDRMDNVRGCREAFDNEPWIMDTRQVILRLVGGMDR